MLENVYGINSLEVSAFERSQIQYFSDLCTNTFNTFLPPSRILAIYVAHGYPGSQCQQHKIRAYCVLKTGTL